MHNFIAGLAFLCLFTTNLNAQQLAQQLDQLFEAAYAQDGPGASILIGRGDKIIYDRQIGLANIENSAPISAASVFSAGSIAKQFTVAALLQLEGQGKLRLSDSIQQHLPDYPLPEVEITLEQLVNHTSGIKDYPRIKKVRETIRNEPSVDEIIKLALAAPAEFSPGSDYGYSNTGYLLLGKVIERISGQPFEAYLRDHIFLPAGMEASSFTDFLSVLPNRTTPYSFDDDRGLIRATPHAYSSAAGGLMTTAGDLHKWMRALLSGKILGQPGLNLMFAATEQVKETPYYGWEVNEISGILSYEHTGFEPGYKASSIYLPESEYYIIVLQNTEHGSPTTPLLKAAAICLETPYPSPSDEKFADQSQLERFTGRYEFPGEIERIVKLAEGRLFYQAPGGLPAPLYFQDSLTLFFEDGYRQLHLTPEHKNTPRKLAYKNRKYQISGQLITAKTPAEKKAIEVPVATLKTYVGSYQAEHFLFLVKLKEGMLWGGADENDMIPLTPYAAHKFFIPELGAEIDFEVLRGQSVKIKILTEGEVHVGIRQ